MEYVGLFIIKIIDNIILTAKSITTYKEKKILSSVLVMLSQLIFYLIVDRVVKNNSLFIILVIAISSGIGNYIAFLINDKFKIDDKWSIVLTSSDIDDVKRFCNYLAKFKIKYIANDGYTLDGDHTINIIAFCKTKDESRLVEKYLRCSNSKYLKEVI